MKKHTKYGYVRPFANEYQFEEQIANLIDNQVRPENIFSDDLPGVFNSYPNFELLCGKLKSGDELAIVSLDRIARSIREGRAILSSLFEKGVSIQILNLGRLDDSDEGKKLFEVITVFSEFERVIANERAFTGKNHARSREGYRDGRPTKFSEEEILEGIKLKEEGYSYKEIKERTNISKATLYRAIQRKNARQ